MKFPYHVRHNGIDYAPNTEVPMDKVSAEVVEEVVKEVVEKETSSEEVIEDAPKYSKTEINRMPIDELKKLAKAEGFDDADAMNGSDIKKALIEKFGL